MEASNGNAEPFYLTAPMQMNNNHWLLRSHMIPTLTLHHKTNFLSVWSIRPLSQSACCPGAVLSSPARKQIRQQRDYSLVGFGNESALKLPSVLRLPRCSCERKNLTILSSQWRNDQGDSIFSLNIEPRKYPLPFSRGDSAQETQINLWLMLLRVHLSSLLLCQLREDRHFLTQDCIASPYCDVVSLLSRNRILAIQRLDTRKKMSLEQSLLVEHLLCVVLQSIVYCSENCFEFINSAFVFLSLFHYTHSRPENTVNQHSELVFLLSCYTTRCQLFHILQQMIQQGTFELHSLCHSICFRTKSCKFPVNQIT